MTADELVALGNQCREQVQPEQALAYYAQAFAQDRHNVHAFNNYGNVLRELGEVAGSVPFLQRAIQLDPKNTTAQFNLSVAYLLQGDCDRGWPQYEHRWNFEHLAGTLPAYSQPRWTGQDLKNRTILVIGEQGHGDNIQFFRFLKDLRALEANVVLQVNSNVGALFDEHDWVQKIVSAGDQVKFDYWTPIMSLPGQLKMDYNNMEQPHHYLNARADLYQEWITELGPKKKLRVGFCWSGRRDSWINQHKGMPQSAMLNLIHRNPNYDWFNLQLDATPDETQKLIDAGVVRYPPKLNTFADTAAMMTALDVIVTVDTAVAHLAGALGRPAWIMLSQYAVDWRWLLDRDTSPWYLTARLFRQQERGNWSYPLNQVDRYLRLFKI